MADPKASPERQQSPLEDQLKDLAAKRVQAGVLPVITMLNKSWHHLGYQKMLPVHKSEC